MGFVGGKTKEEMSSVEKYPICMGNYYPLFVNGEL
jgi:hypothetical protein